jgi:hypothetical protein
VGGRAAACLPFSDRWPGSTVWPVVSCCCCPSFGACEGGRPGLCWFRGKRGDAKPRAPSLSLSCVCPDPRRTPRLRLRDSPGVAGTVAPHPSCLRDALQRRHAPTSLRSLSSSPAVGPSCPASARARSPREGARVRPAVHGFLRRVKIRPPPSSSPPPPFFVSYLFPPLPPASGPHSKP